MMRLQRRAFSAFAIIALLATTSLPPHLTLAAATDSDSVSAPATVCQGVSEIPQSECDALVALYNGTNGLSWTNQTGWLATITPCSWFGVTCNAGHVESLALNQNNLVGTIPTELGNLSQLVTLSLRQGQLTGTIPSTLNNLTNLRNLHLFSNQLSGPVPSWLNTLPNLTQLELGDNQLTGAIPVWLGGMTNLTLLGLKGNQLTGPVPPELGNLTNLTHLDLSSNPLSGSIPSGLGNLSQLTFLWLRDSQLTGTIPSTLGSLTNLQQLELSFNQLSGPIPVSLGNLTGLTNLNLGANQLTGTIPSELGNLTNLTSLNLGWCNHLTGSIPPELGNLTKLTYFTLNCNDLTGPIPPQLGQLAQLQYLYLQSNHLSGNIPTELGQLTNLRQLHLGLNMLTGTIPSSLGNLVNLEFISVQANALEGEIPSSLTQLVNLHDGPYPDAYNTSAFNYNKLTATVPALIAFLDQKSGWRVQTVPPADLQVTGNIGAVQLSWTPVDPALPPGYYEVSYSTAETGPFSVHGLTSDLSAPSYMAYGLTPGTPYYFRVRTFTPVSRASFPGVDQQNALWSDYSPVISATALYAAPHADFAATPISGVVPLPVAFTNLSTGVYSACAWAFGDNTTSSVCNPLHTFTSTGLYSVTLTITGPGGSDVASRNGYIGVGSQAQVEPSTGGALVYTDTTGTQTDVQVPPSAVTASTTLAYTPIPTSTAPANLAFAGHAFELSANQNGTPLEHMAFQQPITVTIQYTDGDVANVSENDLMLYYWDTASGQWLDASTTCSPQSVYERHPDQNWLAVPICHLSRFAVFGTPQYYLFLPLIMR